MLGFYYVDQSYINYLQQTDQRVPNVSYRSNSKFVCGIVLSVNGVDYFVPVSHNTTPMRTSMIIYRNGRPLSSLRFSFMFPCKQSVLTSMSISSITQTDPSYANLVAMELSFCSAHERDIIRKANQVYNIGCDQSTFLGSRCLNFIALENACLQYT